jgi:hypothetical protein
MRGGDPDLAVDSFPTNLLARMLRAFSVLMAALVGIALIKSIALSINYELLNSPVYKALSFTILFVIIWLFERNVRK